MFLKALWADKLKKCVEKYNLERAVILKECPQHICLIPCFTLKNPFFRVLKRVEDIMEMNIYPAVKNRQDPEKQIIYITVDLADMCGIYEKDVIFF